jgi:hypothetical protein
VALWFDDHYLGDLWSTPVLDPWRLEGVLRQPR